MSLWFEVGPTHSSARVEEERRAAAEAEQRLIEEQALEEQARAQAEALAVREGGSNYVFSLLIF